MLTVYICNQKCRLKSPYNFTVWAIVESVGKPEHNLKKYCPYLSS